MKLLAIFLFFATGAYASQTCELSFYSGDKILKTKKYVLPEFSGSGQVIKSLSNRYYKDHQKKHQSIEYSVKSYIEYKQKKVSKVDFIIHREVERFSVSKFPASLFSQVPERYPLERISIRIDQALGKKVYQIDDQNSFELSCKRS